MSLRVTVQNETDVLSEQFFLFVFAGDIAMLFGTAPLRAYQKENC